MQKNDIIPFLQYTVTFEFDMKHKQTDYVQKLMYCKNSKYWDTQSEETVQTQEQSDQVLHCLPVGRSTALLNQSVTFKKKYSNYFSGPKF